MTDAAADSATAASKEYPFVLEVMKAGEEYETCLKLAASSFVTRNPIMKHLKIPEAQLYDMFQKDTKDAIHQGLCIVAKKKTNNEIVGFLMTHQCDWVQPDAAIKPPPDDPFRHSYDAGESLYMRAARTNGMGVKHVAKGETLRVACGVTAAGYEGQGVGKVLRLSLKQFSKDRGFKRILVEAMSPATIHIWRDLCQYELRGSLRLAEFQGYGGVYHFQGLDPPDTEMAIYEGIVDTEEVLSFAERYCGWFWLAVILFKSRYWFTPYDPSTFTGSNTIVPVYP